MPEIRVVNQRHSLIKHPTVLIDRSTWLGNPYRIGKHGDRRKVIQRYREYFDDQMLTHPNFRHKFYTLAKEYSHYDILQLACWCSPLPCHGDVIKQALEEIYREL